MCERFSGSLFGVQMSGTIKECRIYPTGIKRLSALASLSFVLGIAEPAFSKVKESCLLPPMELEAEAKAGFHQDMGDLIAAASPEQAELGQISADLQGALAHLRVDRVGYLLRADPERLAAPGDLRGFSWEKADEVQFSGSDPDYAALSEKVERLMIEIKDHPGWPALRTLVQDQLADTKEYKALLEDFLARLEALQSKIATCFEGP
ncbi:MAG: hypothetical protein AAF530_06710 [Pseudomonadota bacterium]